MRAKKLRATQVESRKLRDELIASPYTTAGGYPRFAVCHDGGALCCECCKSEARQIGTTTGRDGWAIAGLAVNWEDPDLLCDHCGDRIESAYGEPS
jgi:hypothetical protein